MIHPELCELLLRHEGFSPAYTFVKNLTLLSTFLRAPEIFKPQGPNSEYL